LNGGKVEFDDRMAGKHPKWPNFRERKVRVRVLVCEIGWVRRKNKEMMVD